MNIIAIGGGSLKKQALREPLAPAARFLFSYAAFASIRFTCSCQAFHAAK
jgi:hypothetical protein